jgi:hypothetical protein
MKPSAISATFRPFMPVLELDDWERSLGFSPVNFLSMLDKRFLPNDHRALNCGCASISLPARAPYRLDFPARFSCAYDRRRPDFVDSDLRRRNLERYNRNRSDCYGFDLLESLSAVAMVTLGILLMPTSIIRLAGPL